MGTPPSNSLTIDESRSLAKARRPRNLAVLCLLVLFVVGAYVTSFWHASTEVKASIAGQAQSR